MTGPGEERGPETGADTGEAVNLEALDYREAVTKLDRKEKSGGSRLLWLIGTMVLFVLLRGTEHMVFTLIAMIPVLFLHEMGHALAMKLRGYRDISFFFIPMLGAATGGRKSKGPADRRRRPAGILAGGQAKTDPVQDQGQVRGRGSGQLVEVLPLSRVDPAEHKRVDRSRSPSGQGPGRGCSTR